MHLERFLWLAQWAVGSEQGARTKWKRKKCDLNIINSKRLTPSPSRRTKLCILFKASLASVSLKPIKSYVHQGILDRL